jgi:hypothetical protein
MDYFSQKQLHIIFLQNLDWASCWATLSKKSSCHTVLQVFCVIWRNYSLSCVFPEQKLSWKTNSTFLAFAYIHTHLDESEFVYRQGDQIGRKFAIVNRGQCALYLGYILLRKGHYVNFTEITIWYNLGDFRRPLGDMLTKHLVTLFTGSKMMECEAFCAVLLMRQKIG